MFKHRNGDPCFRIDLTSKCPRRLKLWGYVHLNTRRIIDNHRDTLFHCESINYNGSKWEEKSFMSIGHRTSFLSNLRYVLNNQNGMNDFFFGVRVVKRRLILLRRGGALKLQIILKIFHIPIQNGLTFLTKKR